MNGWSIRQACEEWVNEFNRIPKGMIEKLIENGQEYVEVTMPGTGDEVVIITGLKGVVERSNFRDRYGIRLDNGEYIEVPISDVRIRKEWLLPEWGWMWQFNDSEDIEWLEEHEGILKMSECGFRVYFFDDFGYWFGIDEIGTEFYREYWIPLYKVRGMHWHDEEAS